MQLHTPMMCAACLMSALIVLSPSRTNANPPPSGIPEDRKISGSAVGCQSYTFKEFSIMDAIEKTAASGAKVIELFPGQRFRDDQPAVSFNHNSPDAVMDQVKAQLKKYDVMAVNYGVVSPAGKTDAERAAEWAKIFTFAKKMNLVGVTSEPNPKDLDVIEKLVKENNIRFCIHDHPRKPYDPTYEFWDPSYVLSLVKDRDSRMGACADIGHWARSGVKPVNALKILQGRVMSSHMKDLTEFGNPTAHDVPWGQGICGIKDILDELKRQGFDGNISIEYEYNWKNSLPEVTQCIEFVKAYGKGK